MAETTYQQTLLLTAFMPKVRAGIIIDDSMLDALGLEIDKVTAFTMTRVRQAQTRAIVVHIQTSDPNAVLPLTQLNRVMALVNNAFQ